MGPEAKKVARPLNPEMTAASPGLFHTIPGVRMAMPVFFLGSGDI